jgi:hypothetical protein
MIALTDAPTILINSIVRWLHIIPAALAIGGIFFMAVILPAATFGVDAEARATVLARARRIFKMVIHTSILLLLLTGIFNSIRLFPQYKANPGLTHALWGMHMLLALVAIGISIWLLKGPQPPAGHRTVALLNFILLLLLVLSASTLKTVRESHLKPGHPNPTTQP